MTIRGWGLAAVCALASAVGISASPLQAPTAAASASQTAGSAAADQPVPKDLRPLLAPRQSELRLVTLRYTLDRGTLAGNYLGPVRTTGGRGAAAQPAPTEPLSPGRIARLKRFDLDWQASLARLDAAKLSPAGKADLQALGATVAANLKQLDEESSALARLSPVVPFAPVVVRLVEARIRLEDLDPRAEAGALTSLARQVAETAARVEAGLAGASSPGAPGLLRVGKDEAARGASAVETLRANLAEWFAFYNGYDPLFTWWMGLPYKRADAALASYATLLRDKVAPAGLASPLPTVAAPEAIAAGPSPTQPSVPDLEEIVALPQDEMTAIVERFRGPALRGGRAERPASGAATPRDRTFYEGWLRALKTIDFDRLSRNGKVDYLYIRRNAELQIARAGVTLPADPPRKTDASGIPGPARGRQGLIFDLQDDFIPYAPEELIALAEKEYAWCEAEMKKASNQMGFGDDWKRALERVKDIHPPPGGQAAVVRDLMREAVDYLRANDLLTVPGVAAESLHMIMMTPERQLVNPFFTGGSLISVSYPTDTMEFDARIQSMRGNNTPMSHATAFHEMIPGHNLVFYSGARFAGYRPSLGGSSPFYGEGWPLYWEMVLYDMGFHDTPEKRVGALFWRMHRCARIVFSLRFHMGEWSPQECIDYLVDRVGFERENAIAEVRRSFQGSYGPLYQAAYLLGGLQMRALRRELVEGGVMTQKAFHDEVMRQGSMPLALLRLAVGRQPLTRTMSVDWKFYGDLAGR